MVSTKALKMKDTTVQNYEKLISYLSLELRVAYEMNVMPMQGKSLRGVLESYGTAKKMIDFGYGFSLLFIMFGILSIVIFYIIPHESKFILPGVMTSIVLTIVLAYPVSHLIGNKYVSIHLETRTILEKFEKDMHDLFCHKNGVIDPERVGGPVLEMQLVAMAETVLRKEADYQYARSLPNAPAQVMLMACQSDIQAHEHFETMWNAAKLFGVTKRTKESVFNQAKGQIRVPVPPKDWDKLHE